MATTIPSVILSRRLPTGVEFVLWVNVPAAQQAAHADPTFESANEDRTADELAALQSGAVAEFLTLIPFRFVAGSGAMDEMGMYNEAFTRCLTKQADLALEGSLLVEGATYDGVTVTLPGTTIPVDEGTPPAFLGPASVIPTAPTTATVHADTDQDCLFQFQYGPTFATTTTLTTAFATTFSAAITGFTEGATYQGRVYAENAAGLSTLSAVVTWDQPLLPPVFVAGPAMTQITATTAVATATASEASTMTVVVTKLVNGVPAAQSTTFGPTASATGHSLTLTGLVAATAYQWVAKLTDGLTITTSALATFTTQTASQPIDLTTQQQIDALLSGPDGTVYTRSQITDSQVLEFLDLYDAEFWRRAVSTTVGVGIDIFQPALPALTPSVATNSFLSTQGGGDEWGAHAYAMWRITGNNDYKRAADRIMEVAIADSHWITTSEGQTLVAYTGSGKSWALASLLHADAGFKAQARQVVNNYAYKSAKSRSGDFFDVREAGLELEWMLSAYVIGLTTLTAPAGWATGVGPLNTQAMLSRKVDFLLNHPTNATKKQQSDGAFLQKADGTGGGHEPEVTFTGSTVSGSPIVTWTGGATALSALKLGCHIVGTGITSGTMIRSDATLVATVTATSTAVTRVSGVTLAAYHAGRPITGTGIPAGTTVASVNTGAQTLVLSAAATISGSPTLTIASRDATTLLINANATATSGATFTVGGNKDTRKKPFMDAVTFAALSWYAKVFPSEVPRVKTALTMAYQTASSATTVIDLSDDYADATARMSGLLHSITATEPTDDYVLPLKLQTWRTAGPNLWLTYDRLAALGATVQCSMADFYGYPGGGVPIPTTNATTMATWMSSITYVITRSQSEGKTFQYDIWNEPNGSYFWGNNTVANFRETWRQAYLKIRELDPTGTIIGPSAVGAGGTQYVKDFLTYCKANNVVPDIVSWHHNVPDTTGRVLKTRIDDMKAWLVANDIKNTGGSVPTRISINEWYGDTASMFASMEEAGADSAARTCWGVDCTTPTLDGLVTNRQIWSMVKAYADITGRLLRVTPSTSVDGVAGHDAATERVRAILSRKPALSDPWGLTFTNVSSLAYLGTRVRVVVDGVKGFRDPHNILDTVQDVVGDAVTVTVPDYCLDAYNVNCTTTSGYKQYVVRVEPSAAAPDAPMGSGTKGWFAKTRDADGTSTGGAPLDYSNLNTQLTPAYVYEVDENEDYLLGAESTTAPNHYASLNAWHVQALGWLYANTGNVAYRTLANLLLKGMVSAETSGRPTGGGRRELIAPHWRTMNQYGDAFRNLKAHQDPATYPITTVPEGEWSYSFGPEEVLHTSSDKPVRWPDLPFGLVSGDVTGGGQPFSFFSATTGSATTGVVRTRGTLARPCEDWSGAVFLTIANRPADIQWLGGGAIHQFSATKWMMIAPAQTYSNFTDASKYHARLELLFSLDAGSTWTWTGTLLKSQLPYTGTFVTGPHNMGFGTHLVSDNQSVGTVGDYLYVHFVDYTATGVAVNQTLARGLLFDLEEWINGGAAAPLLKWDGSDFTINGLTGLGVALPGLGIEEHSSVVYNTHLALWLQASSSGTGTDRDAYIQDAPTLFGPFGNRQALAVTPGKYEGKGTLVALDGSSQQSVGQDFWYYYAMSGPPIDTATITLCRRRLSIVGGTPPVGGTPVTYSIAAQYSSVQGQSGWNYLRGDNVALTWDVTANAWLGPELYMRLGTVLNATEFYAHPGANNTTRSVKLRWSAPSAGVTDLTATWRDADPGGGDGVSIKVRKVIGGVTTSLVNTTMANNVTIPVTHTTNDIAMASGDYVELEVGSGLANNLGNDSTALSFILVHTPT